MDESKPDQSLDTGVTAGNELERGKEETEAPVHTEKHPTHKKETHGLRDDFDVNTPISDVKGPNVFERVKEEFEAIVETIHPHKEDKNQDSPSNDGRDDATTASKHEKQSSLADKGEGPNVLERGKEETEAHERTEKHPAHNKETHGLRDDIDVNTPISDVKGPNVFERVKEEFEAIVESIHPHEDDKNQDSPSNDKRDDAALTGSKHEKQSLLAEDHTGVPSKNKQENVDVKAEMEKSPGSHHKETHGKGEDINVDIPVSEFRGPSIFHRAKEEIEAIVDTIHSKKESDHDAVTPKKEGGFRATIGKKLQRIYTHKSHNRE